MVACWIMRFKFQVIGNSSEVNERAGPAGRMNELEVFEVICCVSVFYVYSLNRDIDWETL